MSHPRKRPTELTPSEKNMIAQTLISNSTKGKVHRGLEAEIAASFGVSKRTIQYTWAAARKQQMEGKAVVFSSNKQGITHQKRTKVQLDEDLMKSIPFHKRSTIRKLASELNCNKTTVGRWVQQKVIIPHTNAIHPQITMKNQIQRLKYCLESLDVDSFNNNMFKFQTMHNVVHIDEKWFYMTKTSERTYKLPEEISPYRTCKSKRFIIKVMFMCAVTRPIYGANGELIFDGKIGIFPFIKEEPAQRNSRNRLRGTLVRKPIESVNKEVIKGCLIDQIIPAIKAKWPASSSKDIIIQQDNAKPHISNLDPDFRAVATSDGFNIKLTFQPPNSPDTNVNDLGWFTTIQNLQDDTKAYNVDELLKNVCESFDELDHITLNKVFLSLQGSLIEVMKIRGHNDYKLPHMYKDGLIRMGTLPLTLEVEEVMVRDCIEHLIANGELEADTNELEALRSALGY